MTLDLFRSLIAGTAKVEQYTGLCILAVVGILALAATFVQARNRGRR
jgi:hypothetical protein